MVKPKSKTLGCLETEDNSQITTWDCAKGKKQKKKVEFPLQPKMIWTFSYFLCFAYIYLFT